MINIDKIKEKGKILFNELNINSDNEILINIDFLKEDMFQAELPNNYLLDIGWKPSFDPDGAFHIFLVKDYDWEQPVLHSISKGINDLNQEIQHAIDLAVQC